MPTSKPPAKSAPPRPARSTKPVWEKLRWKPGMKAAVHNAPDGFDLALPDGTRASTRGTAALHLVFAPTRREVAAGMKAVGTLEDGALLWVAYSKAKGSELNRDLLREALAAQGLDSVALVALDDTWAAMRFKQV